MLASLALLVAVYPQATGAQALTLGEAVDRARATYPALAAATARAESAERAEAAARAPLFPAISASAQLTRFEEPMVVAPLHAFDPTAPPRFDETLVQGRLSLDYTLFDWGERTARLRAAGESAAGAALGREVAEADLIEGVAATYLRVLTERSVRDAALAQVQALEGEHARALQAVEVGTAAEVERLRAGAALQDAVAAAASAEARLALAERSLARLMGVDAAEVSGRALAELVPDEPRTADAAPEPAAGAAAGPGAGSSLALLAENPVVARARRSVRAAEARLEEARAARLPRVAASAALVDDGAAGGDHVLEWQAGVQLTWLLFTGGARGARIGQAGADARAARAELALAELATAQAVDEATAALADAEARVAALEAAVAQWSEVARIEALGLEAGAGVQSDLLGARAALFRASAGHAAARYEALLARVRLARARGVLDRAWIDEALEIVP